MNKSLDRQREKQSFDHHEARAGAMAFFTSDKTNGDDLAAGEEA